MIKHVFENRNLRKGFTMVELLVVISIIGLLSSVVLASTNQARDKAQIAKAQAELRQIVNSIAQLESDTGLSIGKNIIGQCGQGDNQFAAIKPIGPDYSDGAEYPLSGTYQSVDYSGFAGIIANDGEYNNWDGPYLSGTPADPWGRSYWFDPDYQCRANIGDPLPKGCENAPRVGTVYRVIYSRGPITDLNFPNDYGADNIVRIICENG